MILPANLQPLRHSCRPADTGPHGARAIIRAPMPALPDSLPPPATAFAVDYRDGPLDALLADPRLLAVFGFGAQAPPNHDAGAAYNAGHKTGTEQDLSATGGCRG